MGPGAMRACPRRKPKDVSAQLLWVFSPRISARHRVRSGNQCLGLGARW
jgi:hypothetical protein